jgi:hypothetical protein
VIKDPIEAIEWLIACETAAADALQAAIEPTGREGDPRRWSIRSST